MSRRILSPELVTLLAERSGVTKRKAEAFVRAFFDSIETGLTEDKLVKVKGFGTFKVVNVSARESVDINTGERITLESRNKITFTPDPVLKEIANKPFAQFQTVTLPDDVTDEDLAIVEQHVEEELAKEIPVEEAHNTPGKEETPAEEVPAEVTTTTEATTAEEPAVQTFVSTQEEKPAPSEENAEKKDMVESVIEEDVKQVEEEKVEVENAGEELEVEEGKKSSFWKYLLLLLWTCSMFLLGYFCGNRHLFERQAPAEAPQPTAVAADTTQKDTLQADTTAVATDSLNATASEPTATAPAPQEAAPALPLHPKGNIDVTGQMGTHTLTRGESIEMVAKKYYGSKDYAYYIIKYNELKNPDIVHVGTQLKLPQLSVRQ